METLRIREYPSEDIEDLSFAPVGLDEPYRIIVANNAVNCVGALNNYR